MKDYFVSINQNNNFLLDLEFNITQGVTCLIGNSGAGKSSVLRIISGLDYHPNNYVALKDIWQNKKKFTYPHKRKVAYAMQGENLFSHINIAKNIKLIKFEENDYAKNLKSILNIEPLELKFPHELSGGEKQRVALYKALICECEIILLDEPLSAIDTHHKKIILQEIQRIKPTINKPILYVSHNYDEVAQIADQIICIEKGRKVFDTEFSSQTLNDYFQKNEPNQISSLFNMKLFNDTSKDLSTFRNDDFTVITPNRPSVELDTYRIKILAKDISITTVKPEKTSILNIIEARIESFVKMENSTLVAAKIGNSVIYSLISTHSFKLLELKPDQKIWLQLKALSIN